MQLTNDRVVSGIIKSIDPRGRHGFIEMKDGKELYFRITDGRKIEITDGQQKFSKIPEVRHPNVGDAVLYLLKHAYGGNRKAYPWGFDPNS